MLGDMDLSEVMRRLAERRIEKAMEEGKFDNLERAGKPLELEPMPADEDARAAWWAMRILKNTDNVPAEVKRRAAIGRLRAAAEAATGEERERLTAEHDALVREHNKAELTKLPTLRTIDG